jgi:hypothetical protein
MKLSDAIRALDACIQRDQDGGWLLSSETVHAMYNVKHSFALLQKEIQQWQAAQGTGPTAPEQSVSGKK